MEEHVRSKITRYFEKYPLVKFRAGDNLIQANSQPQFVYFIISGHVKQSDISKRGAEIVLNVFQTPSFFPVTWALNGSQNVYNYIAVGECVARRAPIAEVLEWLKTDPDVLLDLLMRLQSGLEGLMRRMAYAMTGTAQEKVVSELIINGLRFGKIVNKGFILHLSINELAARCGVARETASRELASLREKNLIHTRAGYITVHDKSQLAELI